MLSKNTIKNSVFNKFHL